MNEHAANMSAETRRSQLLDVLEAHGERSVTQLAQRFSVSDMTIRRDLQDLATTGKVVRTHGGAAPAKRVSFEFRFLERAGERAAQKEAIAEVAAGLVQPGQSVLLDSGTTTLAIARRLKAISRVTVVTTSLPIASELFGFEHIDLILLGGKLRTDAPDLTGALTEHSLEILRADIGFIGADAVGADGWLYNASAELGRMLRRLSASCTATYAVADSSKIGRHELMRFADLREWYGLITDRGLPADSKRMFQKMGIRTLQPKASTKARRAGSVSRQRV